MKAGTPDGSGLVSLPIASVFVGRRLAMALLPPACGEMVVENPLSRVGHTHTHTVPQSALCIPYVKRKWCNSFVHIAPILVLWRVTSHLKSLRKTEKENKAKAHEEGKKER